MSKNTRTRILLTAVAALLLVVMAVGGTLAWLTDVTPVVQNTFSPSDVHISLTETWNTDGDDEDDINDSWTAQLIPGKTYTKDPVVAVDDTLTNVDLWVFVKVEGLTNAQTYMDVTVAQGWTALTGVDGVYYRPWTDEAEVDSWSVLTGDKVVVKDTLTADDLYNASAELKITAYAIQQEGFTTENPAYTTELAAVTAAWGQVGTMTEANDGNLDKAPHETAHGTDGI